MRGFTVIELLVVIVILGLVSTLSIPALGRVYENVQKDTVLQDVSAIESAVRNHCARTDIQCEAGRTFTNEDLDGIVFTVLEGYDIEVTVSPIIGRYYVTYYHDDARSFPYDQEGNFMGLLSPLMANRDAVHVPSSHNQSLSGFGPSSIACDGDTDAVWQEQVYTGGQCVKYDDSIFYARHYVNPNQLPGSTDAWQEVSPHWRFYNIYVEGDRVIHQGHIYEATHWTQGDEPGTHVVWQKHVNAWEPLNTYWPNDTVEHNNQTWRATHWTRGDQPGESSVWEPYDETINDKPIGDLYNPNVIYLQGDRVVHNGMLYEARWWTEGDEPGTHIVWQAISDNWHFYNTYVGGEHVNHNNQTWEARWETQGDEPGTHNVWQLID